MRECPERALKIEKLGDNRFQVRIATEYCLGTACKNCEQSCPEDVIRLSDMKIVERPKEAA